MFCFPKKSKKSDDGKKTPNKKFNKTNPIQIQSPQKYDEKIVNILQTDLNDTPDWFVLNNVLMSFQFFENYQKDVLKTSQWTANKVEKELNKNLLKDENICISPDVVFDRVNGNVRFRPIHGPNKHHSEPLGIKRLFVVNDTIEAINSMDLPQYTSIDKPSYQVRIEESPRKGFVRLKFLDTNKSPKIYENPPSSLTYEPKPGSSKGSDSSDYYEYSTITDLRTPKPLKIKEDDLGTNTLPRTCFFTKKQRNLREWFIENENNAADLKEEDLFENVTYVNAKGFMSYFKNVLFPNSLGKPLGFDEEAISSATAIPGKVFCNFYDDDDNPIPCEIVPAVAIDWPAEQAYEFVMREDRPTITDWRTGFKYRWPTDDMIKEIKLMSCVLIPTGYWKKKGENFDEEIEWEIAFPKAERYIESKMSHTQMRCFLFLLAIHKTFINPVTKQYGLLVEHIRCHMYWECEQDYRDWPEHRLGFKLKKVITNLYTKLAKGHMSDYFIKAKNVFDNIPRKYLLIAQEVFYRTLENPLMYFLRALRNVRYTSCKFYPSLDINKLHKIVIENNAMKMVNPGILNSTPPNMIKVKNYYNSEMQWEHFKQLKEKEKYLDNIKKKNGVEERRDSIDSIDLEKKCEKQFDMIKNRLILQMFTNQFIDIAKDSSRLSTKEQAFFYLKQALYLTNILENYSAAMQDEINNFREIIKEEEVKIKKIAAKTITDVPPVTPVRNSVQFDFNLTQQVRNNLVDLNNLNNSYNKGNNINNNVVKRTTSARQGSPVARAKRNDKSISFIEPKKK